jgi:predicted CXXCH cytochrome family protein
MDPVRLDAGGEVQCTSCHDPHREWLDPEVGKFLVKPSRRSALCLSCHERLDVGPPGSAHATSTAPFPPPAGEPTPFATLEDAGCAACHVPHGADVQGQLVKRGATDDAGCLRCHASGAVGAPIGADVAKPYAHVADRTGGHDAGEGRAGSARPLPETSAGQSRHVACVDCHDPHTALASGAAPARVAPAVQGALIGAWGIDINGERVDPARYEYEICLKCHGDSANARSRPGAGAGGDVRGTLDRNLRLVFDPSSPSFHPVAAPGRGTYVPSLKAPLSTASLVYCTDCHASDSGPNAGGAGARGPHGSIHTHLLERQYNEVDPHPESPAAYALCYKCHERNVLLSNGSAFPLHDRHVRVAMAACGTCHDAHGVSALSGTELENAHLIHLDETVVKPGPRGERRYQSAGPGHGSCTLTCHEKTHDSATY